MPPQTLIVLLQGLSSFAIASGLIFTAIQFRQARKAQHVANFSKLVELQMQLRRMRVDDPSLAEVERSDTDNLRTDKQVREFFMNLMQLSLFEIAWFSHRHGQLPDDYYASWIKRMESLFKQESFRAMIHSPSMKIMHDDFQDLVTQLAIAADKPAAA